MVDEANKIEDDASRRMIFPGDSNENGAIDEGDGVWIAPDPDPPYADPNNPTKEELEDYGKQRWDSFVDELNILGFDTDGDGQPDRAYWNDSPQLNGWRQKTIYFAPDCDAQTPRGLTAGRNFGIRAEVPVLVN